MTMVVLNEENIIFLNNTSFINNKSKWKNLSAVGMMKCYREENTKITIKEHYYIISKKLILRLSEMQLEVIGILNAACIGNLMLF